MRSPALAVFDGKLSGIAAPIAAAKKPGGRFDYDAPIEGLQAIDRYTIRLKFDQPEYSLLSDLTTINTAAVAREVIEAYGDANGWAMANPVGSGPYRLKEWRRGQRITLEANPGFRDQSYPDSTDPADKALLATMRGKKIPMIGRIEISIMEESNPRLLAFQGGDLDYLQIPNELIWNVLNPDQKLKPELAKRGIRVGTGIQPAVVYTYFNMEDPVVGGLTTDRIALRRAISMAYNVDEDIRIARQGQAEPSTQPLPPNVEGHDPNFRGYVRYDVARRQGAARQVRLHRSRRRRLARSAGRQAAGPVAGLAAVEQRPPVRRAVAKEPRRGRLADRIRQAEVAGSVQDGARRQAADVDAGEYELDAGRRRILRSALRAERRRSESRALPPARVRRAVRAAPA